MESIVYERDYYHNCFSKHTDNNHFDPKEEVTFFRFYDALMSQMPNVVMKKEHTAIYRLLKECDRTARLHKGKMYAAVDYKNYMASICLTIPDIAFSSCDELSLLREITENHYYVQIQPAKNKWIQIKINIRFFKRLPLDIPNDAQLLQMAKRATEQTGFDAPFEVEKLRKLCGVVIR